MRGLYQCREGTFAEKCQNFYRQGKFMEDYEDDCPWNGDYTRYFPTYHDLNVRQLRGYFTWRAQVRRGEFTPIATSMAYIYVYELLNGIGAASPEDALEKLQAFQTGFVESGVGEASMGKNLRQWMLEFAVLHNLPETARSFASSQVLRRDEALVTLRAQEATDQAVLEALCAFGPKKLEESPSWKKEGRGASTCSRKSGARGWRCPPKRGRTCSPPALGRLDGYPWSPLSNAVYSGGAAPPRHRLHALDPCRIYRCRGRRRSATRTSTLARTSCRACSTRRTGLCRIPENGPLPPGKAGGAWAAPYVEAVLEAERGLEAARPKITIDLSHLEHVRHQATPGEPAHRRGAGGAAHRPVEEAPPAPGAACPCPRCRGWSLVASAILLALLPRGAHSAPGAGPQVDALCGSRRHQPGLFR